MGFKGLLPQALNDGQQPPTGTGAGVPSGQIFKSMVQKTAIQLGFNAIQEVEVRCKMKGYC